MKIALFGINFGGLANPDIMLRTAEHADQAGLDSVWTGEHVVLPDPQAPPSPSTPDTPFLDPGIALAHIAARTKRIGLGTGIIILPQRNPLVLAKELASLDVVSNGRLMFGIGAGYLEPEFRAIGAPFEQRGAVTDDAIAAMKAVWTMPKPAYRGPFFSFENIDAQPRPVQKPHPPFVIGGNTRGAARRTVRHGNGWYGFFSDPSQVESMKTWLAEYLDRGERPAGLGPIELSVTPPAAPDRETVDRYTDLGIHRLMFWSAAQSLDDSLRFVDTLASLTSK